jgi:methionyl-tRNA formyltransferase
VTAGALRITILSDVPDHWIEPFVKRLADILTGQGHRVSLAWSAAEIKTGDVMFILGCSTILGPDVLARHQYNLVVHESAVPRGRGWSPLTWQILEGENDVPITLFEAAEKVDRGLIYGQDVMRFAGHELVDELRAVQGQKTIDLCLGFIAAYPEVKGRPQQGEATYYPRITPKDSRVDPNRSIVDLFNRFRTADNERYPAFFEHQGHRYVLKIYKEDQGGPEDQ